MKRSLLSLFTALALLSACGTPSSSPREGPGFVNGKAVHPYVKLGSPYSINGETYVPKYQPSYSEEGEASWYGPGFHGKSTANGERFDAYAMTAAHKTLPLPSMVRVTNLDNGRVITVRVNDRGPFAEDRIIDLSKKAAQELDMIRTGVAHVRVEYLPRETEAYIAQLGGTKSSSRLAWEEKNTPEPSTQVASASSSTDVNSSDRSSWFPSFISSAEAAEPKHSNETQQAASVSSIDSNDLAPPKGANPALPARLPHPAAADYTVAPKQQSTAPPPAIPEQKSYVDSTFSVLDKQASTTSAQSRAQSVPTAKPIRQASASPPKPVDSPKPSAPQTAIQVGAFNSRSNAEKIAEQFKPLAPIMIHGVPVDSPTIYRVRLGPFTDRYSAESVLSQVREKGAPDAQIVSY